MRMATPCMPRAPSQVLTMPPLRPLPQLPGKRYEGHYVAGVNIYRHFIKLQWVETTVPALPSHLPRPGATRKHATSPTNSTAQETFIVLCSGKSDT